MLELWESVKLSIPVIVVAVERGGFEIADAIELVQHLETELPHRNPGALDALREALAESGHSLSDLQAGIVAALRSASQNAASLAGARGGVSGGGNSGSDGSRGVAQAAFVTEECSIFKCSAKRLVWHPWGTDNQLLADATDLIEEMGRACGKEVRWSSSLSTSYSVQAIAAAKKRLERHMWLPPLRASSLAELTGQRADSDAHESASKYDLELHASTPSRRSDDGRVHRRAQYAAFISYYRAEAGADARRLQTALETLLGEPWDPKAVSA